MGVVVVVVVGVVVAVVVNDVVIVVVGVVESHLRKGSIHVCVPGRKGKHAPVAGFWH